MFYFVLNNYDDEEVIISKNCRPLILFYTYFTKLNLYAIIYYKSIIS